ncbi:hypothetical protein SDC9_113594 [bioreactor metagenome]|uniref:Uncharacterized protein n=1 Tax=bioreactor metagenome TaxID=1076179 RepID=A0A645BYA7_9ZZZZ|nr:hypothetical protein [Candidatus Metalachnospira sp.]
MICIGVFGEKTESFIKQLLKRYFDAEIQTEICLSDEEAIDIAYLKAIAMGKEVFITNIFSDAFIEFDIIVFFSHAESCYINLKYNGYAIINADDCTGLKDIMLSAGITKITCGVTSRAGVTISSIGENMDGTQTIQCCIQHRIRTLSGRVIEPQEFSVNVRGVNYPISEVLSLITTAITGDIEETVTTSTLISND